MVFLGSPSNLFIGIQETDLSDSKDSSKPSYSELLSISLSHSQFCSSLEFAASLQSITIDPSISQTCNLGIILSVSFSQISQLMLTLRIALISILHPTGLPLSGLSFLLNLSAISSLPIWQPS